MVDQMGSYKCDICKKKEKSDNILAAKLEYRDCFLCKRNFCGECSKTCFRYPKSKQNICEECWEKNKDKKWVKREEDD